MKKKYLYLISFTIIVAVFGVTLIFKNQPTDELQVVFFDVGQGDAHFIRTPGGQNILIDGGPDKTVLEKLSKYLPASDRTIDLMILTHPHADHAAGLVEVLQRYDVQRVLATGVIHTTDTYLAWLNEVKEQKIIFDQAVAGKQYKFESTVEPVYLEVIYPDRNVRDEEFDDLNESSVVVMLSYFNKKFLFTGDISVDNELRILKRGVDVSADVLKVSHQGADTSSSQEFLDAVNPQYAIIPVGENNYGHPSLRIIRRIERMGTKIFRTDQDGDIKFIVDSQGTLKSFD